jgi:hypothetical protein
MSIESFRDVVIIIYGIVATLFLITLLVLMLSLYRKAKVIQTAICETAVQLPALVAESRESLQGITKIVGITEAISVGIDLVRKIFAAKKGGKIDEQ